MALYGSAQPTSTQDIALTDINRTANHPAAGNAGIASRLKIGHHLSGVPEPTFGKDTMSYCAFIYTPFLGEADVRSWLELLASLNVKITHLGKNDPPRKWMGDLNSALATILSGTDLTNYTFFRCSDGRLDFSIQLHRDPRWESDTISFSGTAEPQLLEIARHHAERLPCHTAIVGISGGGKDQDWKVVYLSPECPRTLRSKITKA
jgi:hypothetical protein